MQNNNMVIAALVIVVLILAGAVYQGHYRPQTPGQEIAQGVGHALENTGDSIKRAADH